MKSSPLTDASRYSGHCSKISCFLTLLLFFLILLPKSYSDFADDEANWVFGDVFGDGETVTTLSPELRVNPTTVILEDSTTVKVTSAEARSKTNELSSLLSSKPFSLKDDSGKEMASKASATITDDGFSITLSGDFRFGGGIRSWWGYLREYDIQRTLTFNSKVMGLAGNGAAFVARLGDGRIFVWGDNQYRPNNSDYISTWNGKFLELPKKNGKEKQALSIIYFDLTELVLLCQDGSLCVWRYCAYPNAVVSPLDGSFYWYRDLIPVDQKTRKIVAIDSWQTQGWNPDHRDDSIDELMLGLQLSFDTGEIENWYDRYYYGYDSSPMPDGPSLGQAVVFHHQPWTKTAGSNFLPPVYNYYH